MARVISQEKRREKSAKALAYYWSNREEILERNRRKYAAMCPDKKRLHVAYVSSIRDMNYATVDSSRRRALKLQAQPSWLSASELDAMRFVYECARAVTKLTGVQHDVDHIVPLRGKDVCGLHVPWNLQILPESVNARKSNKT